MLKFVSIFVFLMVIHEGFALNCYACYPDTCNEKKAEWEIRQDCGSSLLDETKTGACLKEVYLDQHNKSVTERACVTVDKIIGGAHYNCTKNHTTFCNICFKDLCNSATSLSLNMMISLGGFIILLVHIPY